MDSKNDHDWRKGLRFYTAATRRGHLTHLMSGFPSVPAGGAWIPHSQDDHPPDHSHRRGGQQRSSGWRPPESHLFRELQGHTGRERWLLPAPPPRSSLFCPLSFSSNTTSFLPSRDYSIKVPRAWKIKTLPGIVNPLRVSPFSHPSSRPVRADLHSRH